MKYAEYHVIESSSLTGKQKEAIALLSIGTMLEYFDLSLYVHMAVLLNNLFFPKMDPHTTAIISSFSFCSTFIFRPLGALVFGWIGDHIGRKPTVTITTMMMALSCGVMAMLPTYAQIGITAAWAITICRIVQGLSSMGEMVGAEIYLTELIKPPLRYPIVCLMPVAASLGAIMALGIATIVFVLKLEWRFAFWIGSIIALVGTVARTALRETPEFADAKRRLKKKYEKVNIDQNALKEDVIFNATVNQKTSLAYFFIRASGPVWLYFSYIYCADILKHFFNYSSQEIIKHNLLVAIAECLTTLFFAYLSYKVHPLKIVNIRIIVFSIFIVFIPYLLFNITTAMHLFFIQIFICLFKPSTTPATAIFFTYFPIFKRFTYVSILYALSHALVYIITSFGLVYLTKIFSHWGLLIIFIPTFIGFKCGISHFEKLEKESKLDAQLNYAMH